MFNAKKSNHTYLGTMFATNKETDLNISKFQKKNYM